MLLTGTFDILLCSTAHSQSVVVFSIPKSRDSFEQRTELRYCTKWLEGGGINASIVLPIRRKQISGDLGEVLLLKQKLTIRLPESHGPGGGYSVPSAVLDREACYLAIAFDDYFEQNGKAPSQEDIDSFPSRLKFLRIQNGYAPLIRVDLCKSVAYFLATDTHRFTRIKPIYA